MLCCHLAFLIIFQRHFCYLNSVSSVTPLVLVLTDQCLSFAYAALHCNCFYKKMLVNEKRIEKFHLHDIWQAEHMHRITGFLHFVHCPVFYKLEKTTFRKLDLFPSSGEGEKTPAMLGPLERANLSHLRLEHMRLPKRIGCKVRSPSVLVIRIVQILWFFEQWWEYWRRKRMHEG
jgi:hypothetical protein